MTANKTADVLDLVLLVFFEKASPVLHDPREVGIDMIVILNIIFVI